MDGTLTLIFETSTPAASLARVDAGGRVELRTFTGDRSHNAALFAPLGELLHGHRGEERVGLVLTGSGPGSYSGTRVGIAAAQGVAIASGCAVAAVPSILAVPCADHGASCLAIGDARRGSYWTARVAESKLQEGPVLTDAEGLAAEVQTALEAGMAVFTFDDPARFPLEPGIAQRVLRETPDAGRLWQAWNGAGIEARTVWMAAIPQPLYLKPPHITPAKRPWLAIPQG